MYIIVGANPYRTYTGALTFTSLSIKGVYQNKEEATKAVKEVLDECYGVLIVINEKGENVTSTL